MSVKIIPESYHSYLTTDSSVNGEILNMVAVGEHCTQSQNQNGVNAECMVHVLSQKEVL